MGINDDIEAIESELAELDRTIAAGRIHEKNIERRIVRLRAKQDQAEAGERELLNGE